MSTDALVDHITTHAVELRRRMISNHFHSKFEGRIQQGPLKGFVIGNAVRWGPGDVAAKLFGLYEQEVLAIVEAAALKRSDLINLGAADGYYGVGLVAANVFRRSICYEVSERDREYLKTSAEQNGVSERVRILGRASNAFGREARDMGVSLERALVLCDVEGAEFGIFDDECLEALRDSEIVIELHDFLVDDGRDALQLLIDRAGRHFNARIFKTGFRNLSGIPELDSLSDSDRWLVCSEGRGKMMAWLHLTPR